MEMSLSRGVPAMKFMLGTVFMDFFLAMIVVSCGNCVSDDVSKLRFLLFRRLTLQKYQAG
jgi:hypothetical protein